MGLERLADPAVEPLRAPRDPAAIRIVRLPDDVVVRRGGGGQDRGAALSGISRRALVLGTGALATGIAMPRRAFAAPSPTHGMSSFGELKYPEDFRQFDYVNPMAPKGGRFASQLSQTFGNQAPDTFNTLNAYVLQGEGAAGMNLTFDSLMVRALDEPDALYGLVARRSRCPRTGSPTPSRCARRPASTTARS